LVQDAVELMSMDKIKGYKTLIVEADHEVHPIVADASHRQPTRALSGLCDAVS
jgi:hypothetical protein